MNNSILLIEIGSTTTYATLINFSDEENDVAIIAQGFSLTSISKDDITIGIHEAISLLLEKKKDLKWDTILGCSSAAGGLRVSVHGLMKDMTVKAAKEASLGAGAIICHLTSGKLREFDLKAIKDSKPQLLIISGGTDFGDRETAIHNVSLMSKEKNSIPLIYCGNIENQAEVGHLLKDQEHYLVENVYPAVDEYNVEPLRKTIQRIFEKKIIYAPGFEKLASIINGSILPTPGSVFKSAELLYELVGDLMIIDVGGATTDIHSVTEGDMENRSLQVSIEPKAKRTVDGDLGVFYNVKSVLNTMDKVDAEYKAFTNKRPLNEDVVYREQLLELALQCVNISLIRHTGKYKESYDGLGSRVIVGKDLSMVKTIFLTGGALIKLSDPRVSIRALLSKLKGNYPNLLLPSIDSVVITDKNYILGIAGLLSTINVNATVDLLKRYLLDGQIPTITN